jgi:hypothetical protein
MEFKKSTQKYTHKNIIVSSELKDFEGMYGPVYQKAITFVPGTLKH